MPTTSGCRFSNDLQNDRSTHCIGGNNRVTVHLRTVEWRQVGVGYDIFGKYAAYRVGQINSFGTESAGFASNYL
jgi:hypothetical protein